MNTSVVESLRAASIWDAGRYLEEQAYADTPVGRLFTTAFRPRSDGRDVGFLLCHSFGWEQAELYALELMFARAAARAGFPVLSFHATGYGDTGGDLADVRLSTQVRDATAAAALLGSWDGMRHVVPVGVRWGAAVAAMTAARIDAAGLVAWNPSPDPGKYLDELLRVTSMAGVVDGRDGGLGELKRALLAGETIDLLGYPLTGACYAEAKATDPLDGVDVPRALVLAVNPSHRRAAQRAADRLAERGAQVAFEDAEGEGARGFALGMPLSGHLATNRALFDDIARRTIAWAEGW